MKKVYLFFLLAVGLFSCKKEYGTTSLTVALNQCSSKPFDGVTFCLNSVLDSRCPSGAECFWAGVAIGKFTLVKNNAQYPFTLATFSIPHTYSSDTTVAGYKIRLINILPYPTLSSPSPSPNDIKAEIEISK